MNAPNDPLIGTVAAGRYRVLKQLGEGGMGQVYLAEHIAIEKRVALKVLRPEYASKGDIVTRFQQEAISASRIKHPNVLDVFDFGQLDNGCFYLAMEFLEGNDLADEISRRKVLNPATGIRIALQICRALAAAHTNGVVHRDMKPENVFLQRTGDGEEIVKIVDFGIALLRSKDDVPTQSKPRRLTRTGMIFGTPEYMAPEQAGGKHADLRADVYAVAIILYEMFTGAVPFTGETFLGVLAKHLNERPPPMAVVFPSLAISPQFQAVIMKGLEKDPATRYQSMSEFAQAIIATPEGSSLGYRTMAPSYEGSGSTPPPAGGVSPTAQQFVPAAVGNPSVVAQSGYQGPRTETPAVTGAATTSPLTATRTPTPSHGGLIAVLIGAALLCAGAGALLFLRHSGGATPASAEPASVATAQVAAALPVPSLSAVTAVLSATATPAASEPTTLVAPAINFKLSVTTDPSGATVSKNGFQVCDATPCDVVAAPNETLELQAQKGALHGVAKVLAQRDQKVIIKLLGTTASAPPHAAGAATRMCEVEVDGLKILRPCK